MDTYNTNTLKVMFERIDEKLDDHAKVHTEILSKVTDGFNKVTARQDIANGRISKNEVKIATAQGGLAVVAIIGIPILGWALYVLVNFPITMENRIESAIEEALSVYELPQ